MRGELAKAFATSLGTCVFILWLAVRGDLPKPLVVVFIVAFSIILPVAILIAHAGRLR